MRCALMGNPDTLKTLFLERQDARSTMEIIWLVEIDTNGYCHCIEIDTNLEEFYWLKSRTGKGFGIILQSNSLLGTLLWKIHTFNSLDRVQILLKHVVIGGLMFNNLWLEKWVFFNFFALLWWYHSHLQNAPFSTISYSIQGFLIEVLPVPARLRFTSR